MIKLGITSNQPCLEPTQGRNRFTMGPGLLALATLHNSLNVAIDVDEY